MVNDDDDPYVWDNGSSIHIDQLDGNISLNSSNMSVCETDTDATYPISVQLGYRPSKSICISRLPPVRKTIRRDNKLLQAVSLPKMSSYNMRSLMPKIGNFGTDMEDRNCSISFLTEIWQKTENRKHQFKLEELFEMRGMKYISTPRPGARRGGGAAIVVNTETFSISKLNISIPNNLEIVWGLLRPIEVTGKITKIIVCSFYCPPKSTKKSSLIEHMTLTIQSLRSTFPKAGVIISGDRNDLSIARLRSVDPALRQTVLKGTRGQNILTIVLTDLEVLYEEPIIVKPIDVDDPSKGGVPSDHNGVVVTPLAVTAKPVRRQKFVRTIRPITSSVINNIGQVLVDENWLFMNPDLSPTELTELFEFYTGGILDAFCPQKYVYSRPNDKPFISEDMKIIKRWIMREYEKRGKSVKYCNLKESFDRKFETEVAKYTEKILEDVRTGNRNCAYSALRKLGVRPGDATLNTFTLPSHVEKNLSPQESAELIADHFAAISQDYEPINIDSFPPNIRESLSNPCMSIVPVLEDHQVYKKMCKAKKPNSAVKGDLPKKIVQEFSCELSSPVSVIYRSILKTFQYPRQWVIEYQLPLPKSYPPSSEDELRNIAKTSFCSKVFESLLSEWLMPIVGPFLDPCQYGLKVGSITHYLFKLLQFIHEYLDLKDPHAVVVAMVDLNKAFNRVSHQMVIEDLFNMHVPAWLLLILTSYLTERSMIMHYNGQTSSPRDLPGSSPQGAFLGIFFFVVKYNAASLRPRIPRIQLLTQPQGCKIKRTKCKNKSCTKHSAEMHALYIDDLSEAEAINLKKRLINDPVQRSFPLNYHERTQHVLPVSSLQTQLNKIEQFTVENKMKINAAKSKIMIFNKSKKYDFPPEYTFNDGKILEIIEESKLLGIQLTTDLRWAANTKSIYDRAMSKMWLLRRMKALKLEPDIIVDYYLKEIRVLAEQGVAIWNGGLTKNQIRDLEKIQKVALKIILADGYNEYNRACAKFSINTLYERRLELCTNYAVKLFKSDCSRDFFTHATNGLETSQEPQLVVEQRCRTKGAYNAPHNYLARIGNKNQAKVKLSL